MAVTTKTITCPQKGSPSLLYKTLFRKLGVRKDCERGNIVISIKCDPVRVKRTVPKK